MIPPVSQLYQFGDVTVDCAGMRVFKGAEPVPLEPKSLKVLLYLIENRDRLVTKEELLTAVWPDTSVTDNALTRTIVQIRKALDDDAKQGRIIATVPRLGYRFIAEPAPSPLTPRDETVMAPNKSSLARHWLYVWLALGLLVAAITMLFRSKPPAVVRLSTPVQFTTSTGLDLYAFFSPDGASLAYSSDESGSFEIYVKPLARGARTIQVTSDGRQNVQPAWSPDGRYIAYHSAAEDGIWVVPALGGSPRKLTDFGNAPAWSPDGGRLAFQDKSLISLAATDQACTGPVGNIWVTELVRGAPAQVPLPFDRGVCRNADPSWTADGRVLFARRRGGSTDIVSVAADGSALRVVERVQVWATSLRWVPERASIFFGNFSNSGDFTLQRLPVDRNGKATGPAEEVIGNSLSVPRAFTVSRDGRRFAYTATLPLSQIASLPLRALQPTGPPVNITRENIYRHGVPFISPDGRHVAFTGIRKGANWDVWVIDIDGGNARLATVTESGICFGWLPDSSGVAYLKHASPGSDLWWVSLKDGAERRLSAAKPVGGFISLSPDGRYLVDHTQLPGGLMRLQKLELATGRLTDLVHEKGISAGFGVWSYDGRQIAFESQKGEDVQLATIAANGGPIREWTAARGKTWPGSWAADGQTIIAAAQRDGIWNVYAIGRDGSEKRLTDYSRLREFVRYPRLSPAQDRIIYEYNETKGNIYVGELKP